MKISDNKSVKRILIVILSIHMVLSMTMIAFAANYAENAAKWGLDQAFWIVILITVIVAIGAWLRHATSAMVISVVVGGILAFFCKNPEKVTEIGNALAQTIFGG